MARSKSAARKKPRRPHDGPHWRVVSVPGHQEDGSDTWWYLVYGQTFRRDEIGRGKTAMQKAAREANRRNEAARDRTRK